MPTPAKTSRTQLIAIARRLVEAGGPDALTVSAVAAKAGVRGPSVYKHFVDRDELLRAVEIEILAELERTLRAGTEGRSPKQRLRSMADAYRRFAVRRPHRYAALYSRNAADDPQLADACRASAQPLFEELERAGLDKARMQPLSRTLTAFLHGFVSMEIANAFRLGGDIDHDFAESLETILSTI